MKRTISTGVILLTGLLLTSGCSEWISKRAMDRGLVALRQGDYATATKQLEKASKHIKEADAPTLYYNLGVAQYNLAAYEPAMKAFLAALALAPTDRETLVYIGNIHLKRQEWAEAAHRFEQAAAGRPPDAKLLSALAQAANGAGHTVAARLYLIQALRAEENYAPAYYDLGCLYDDVFALPSEALDQYKIFAIKADPKDPRVAKANASALRLQQVVSRMTMQLPAGVKQRNTGSALKLVEDGDRQRAAHQMAKAEKDYREALAQDPLCHDAAYNLAMIDQSRGAMAESLKFLQAAVRIEPVRQTSLLACAQTALTLKDYRTASGVLDRLIARWPALSQPYASMAVVQQALGHPADARLYAEHYVRLAPPSPDRERYESWSKTLPQ